MDNNHFDGLARAFASRSSRRTGIAAALGALGAAITGRNVADGAAAGTRRRGKGPKPEGPCGDGSAKDNSCKKDKDCCTGYCNNGRCRGVPLGGKCSAKQLCRGKAQCIGGICTRGNTPPPPPQGCTAVTCASGCCDGTTCVAYASQDESTCGTAGAACAACGAGLFCHSGVCEAGVCNATYEPAIWQVGGPSGIATDSTKVYFASTFGLMRSADLADGANLASGTSVSEVLYGVAFNPDDSKLYVLYQSGSIHEVNTTTLDMSSSAWASGSGTTSYGLAFDANGAAWVTTGSNNGLAKLVANDTAPSQSLTGLCSFGNTRGVAVGPGGLLYIGCDQEGMVIAVDPVGPTKLNTTTSFTGASGIAFDGSTMYVTSSNTNNLGRYSVEVVNGEPVFTQECDYTSTLSTPTFITTDSTGKAWVSAFASGAVSGAALTYA
jgi:hypothetical protein